MSCCFKFKSNKVIDNPVGIIIEEEEYFDENEYEPLLLGTGGFAEVYRIKIENVFYSCKKYIKKNDNRFLKEIENFKEISKIKSSRFPYYYKAINSPTNHYLLYSYVEGQDLFEIRVNNEKLFQENHKLISHLIYEITLSLQDLFDHNYVHLDLKPENIIIENLNPIKLKLIDLESCRKLNVFDNNIIAGTCGFVSPEIMLHHKYYYNSDIWSLGIIMYYLYTGFFVFPESNSLYINAITKFNTVNPSIKFLNKFIPESCFLLKQMLQPIYTYRTSVKGILNSKFIKKFQKYHK